MRISAKGKYALKLIVDLAENRCGEYISLSDVSERQNISKKFLEQIVPTLVRSGIIRANRGNRGGYQLIKPPNDCFVGDILRATDGELFPIDNYLNEYDNKIAFVFEGMHNTINSYANNVSIQDILEHQNSCYDYYI